MGYNRIRSLDRILQKTGFFIGSGSGTLYMGYNNSKHAQIGTKIQITDL